MITIVCCMFVVVLVIAALARLGWFGLAGSFLVLLGATGVVVAAMMDLLGGHYDGRDAAPPRE
jgi:hypothetical protein